MEPLKNSETRVTFLRMYDRIYPVTYVENATESGVRDQFIKLFTVNVKVVCS